MPTVSALAVAALILFEDAVPEAEDVKAGWWGLAVFLGLIAAVVILAISLVRHLRAASRNAAEGAFGEEKRD